MEIYTRRVNKVKFEKPTADTVVNSATVSINDATAVALSPVTSPTPTHVEYALPYLQTEGDAKVTYNFTVPSSGTFTDTRTYQIVTPLLSNAEILEIHPHATEAEIVRIERAVRHIIQSHTGQRFGKFVGVKAVKGSASRRLFLPERLLSLTDVNGVVTDLTTFVEGDGFTLIHYPWGVPPIKADAWELHYHTGGVVHNPNRINLGVWNEGHTYFINGVWGYEEIPDPVKEAAKLLVNDYACADANYRDRFLTSMTAADWRIQFNSGAFVNTGNVRADQLLSEYVLRGWAVF